MQSINQETGATPVMGGEALSPDADPACAHSGRSSQNVCAWRAVGAGRCPPIVTDIALGIWRYSVPISGTLAEVYLNARGLHLHLLPNLRCQTCVSIPG